LAVAVLVATPLCAATDDDGYSIMRPEPGTRPGAYEPRLAPKYQSPRGTKQRPSAPRPAPPETRRIPDMPPPVVVPQTGRALPNMPPPVPGSGTGGRETFQDRAARCTHQAGVYGQAAGDNSSYITSCVNQ
jgi:hypothetical protein